MPSTVANAGIAVWLMARALRWLCWIAFFALCIYVRINRATIVTSLNQLPQSLELLIYSLGCAAVFAGFLELIMRERVGLERPRFGELIPPVAK
jgi:branched-subunit amino acid ABC-type transport system permease component